MTWQLSCCGMCKILAQMKCNYTCKIKLYFLKLNFKLKNLWWNGTWAMPLIKAHPYPLTTEFTTRAKRVTISLVLPKLKNQIYCKWYLLKISSAIIHGWKKKPCTRPVLWRCLMEYSADIGWPTSTGYDRKVFKIWIRSSVAWNESYRGDMHIHNTT